MSRSDRDGPGRRYEVMPSWWTKACRRAHRTKARRDLRAGKEPDPKYNGDKAYYD